MTRSRLAIALSVLACASLLPAGGAHGQELNAWDMRGATPLPTYGEPKTRAEVRAELADAREAGWNLNSGEVSWFPEPALAMQLAQRAEERVARRVEAARLAAAHRRQVERVVPVGLRQLRPDFVLPGAIAAEVETAVAVPLAPAVTSGIREDGRAIEVLPLGPSPAQQRTELPPLMLREDRLDFRPLDRVGARVRPHTELPAIEPPEAPPSAGSMPVSPSADRG